MAKRLPAHRIKIHRQYTYETAAEELGVTVQTVRSWRAKGLLVITDQKPHLIPGAELKNFVKSQQTKPTRILAFDEFLCMACRRPVKAYGAMADYVPVAPNRGRLETLCDACHASCVKFASLKMRDDLARVLTIVTRYAPEA